jgi:hypothetical protein
MSEKNATSGQKVYITKYVLTQGIIERVAIESEGIMLVYEDFEACNKRACVFSDDWHLTLDDAKAKALKMIEAKRKNLAKQLKHLNMLESELQ